MAVGVAAFKSRNRGLAVWMAVLATLGSLPAVWIFLCFHPEYVDGRFRTYKAFYRELEIGMTRDEVFAALDRRYPQSGARLRPKLMDDTESRLGFFMNPENSGEPNCEGIFLHLENGRVEGLVYSPD